MTKDEALKLALSTLDEVRQETFRLSRDGQKLYAEDKVWSTIISIKEVLAQEQEPVGKLQEPTAWEQFYPDFGKPKIAINPETVGYVAPQQGPVAWGVFEGNLHDMFFTEAEAQEMADLKGTHAEVRPLYTTPPVLAQPEQESFEYWNAVEGWVKIDEVRKHFDSVGCGTIYKTAGEDRTPLYTTPQRTWVGLTAKEKHEIRYSHMTSAEFIEVIEAKLKQKNGYVEEKNT